MSPAPVAVGSTWAATLASGLRSDVVWVAALAAMAIQVGTNLWNDALDADRGVDRADRLGPPCATAMGWLDARAVRRAACLTFAGAALLARWLVLAGGWPVLVIGGIALGLVSGPPAAAGLLVNTHRDRVSDRKAERRTLAIRLRLGRTPTLDGALVLTVVPMPLGMVLRAWRPAVATALLGPLRRIAICVVVAIVGSALARDWPTFAAEWRHLGPAVLTFNLAAIGAGLTAGAFCGLGARRTLTLGIESGLQNVALALAVTVFADPAVTIPAVLYVVAMNASALGLVADGRRYQGD